MKKISPTMHGYIDYVTVVLFLISPTLIGMTGKAMAIAYALAGIHCVMTVFTDFPLGLARLLPFSIHGWIERMVGPVLIVLPFGLSFDAQASVFYIAMGITIVLVGLFSNYQRTTK